MIAAIDYDGSPTDNDRLTQTLAQSGLPPDSAAVKAALFAQAANALIVETGGAAPSAGFFVPGRIEVLGKHTDYAGGRSIVCAVDRGFCLWVRSRDDRRVVVLDVLRGRRSEFDLDAELQPTLGDWSNYPQTVARRVARNFPTARHGATIAFASDLPPAAGMSSSSAFLVAMFLALDEVNRLRDTAEYRGQIGCLTDLAGYLGTVENGQTFGTLAGDRGVGTFGGSEDQTAILCGQAGRLSQYAYCPVRLERHVTLPAGLAFVVADSGVVAEKTGAARERYNRASKLASAIAALWREATGRTDAHLATALATAPEAAGAISALLSNQADGEFTPEELLARLEHFFVENDQAVPGAGDALAAGDWTRFGQMVDLSQQAAEELLGNQVAETSALARAARSLGALGATSFGAGFGGSVWALVEQAELARFVGDWAELYRAEFPAQAERAQFLATVAGPAAFELRCGS